MAELRYLKLFWRVTNAARDLRSDDRSNLEYDKALVELAAAILDMGTDEARAFISDVILGNEVDGHGFVSAPGVNNCARSDDDGRWCNRDQSDPVHNTEIKKGSA